MIIPQCLTSSLNFLSPVPLLSFLHVAMLPNSLSRGWVPGFHMGFCGEHKFRWIIEIECTNHHIELSERHTVQPIWAAKKTFTPSHYPGWWIRILVMAYMAYDESHTTGFGLIPGACMPMYADMSSLLFGSSVSATHSRTLKSKMKPAIGTYGSARLPSAGCALVTSWRICPLVPSPCLSCSNKLSYRPGAAWPNTAKWIIWTEQPDCKQARHGL